MRPFFACTQKIEAFCLKKEEKLPIISICFRRIHMMHSENLRGIFRDFGTGKRERLLLLK